MRRVIRTAVLPDTLLADMARRQAKVDKKQATADEEWARFIRTKKYVELKSILLIEAGNLERCYFCSDSLGVDIEHFYPKAAFPERAFDFANLLLACSRCNRSKGSQFPRGDDDRPLLLNPLWDDPWDCLYFVPETGLLAPRIQISSGSISEDPRGARTLQVLGDVLNRGGLLSGRQTVWGQLVRESGRLIDLAVPVTSADAAYLWGLDRFGLLEWMFKREGAELPAVRALRQDAPQLWDELRIELRQVGALL